MRVRLLPSVTILVASLCVSAAGIAGGIAELSPYFTVGTTAEQRIAALSSYDYRPGASTTSRALLLDDCEDVTTSVRGMALPSAQRQVLVIACLDYAKAIVEDAPMSGQAWLALARMAANLHDRDAFNNGLRMSRKVSPASNWLASQRVVLAERRIGWLDEESRAAMAEDIAVLVRDRGGTQFLAQLYNNRPEFRDEITQVVETASDDRQRLFLQLVKQASGARR